MYIVSKSRAARAIAVSGPRLRSRMTAAMPPAPPRASMTGSQYSIVLGTS